MSKEFVRKLLKAKQKRLERAFKWIKNGKILEIGCGSGFVLEIISKNFPDSKIFGIDILIDRLKNAGNRDLKNVHLIATNIFDKPFNFGKFDTVLCIDVLHEIFSKKGFEGLRDIFGYINEILKPKGRLIIYEYLRPGGKSVLKIKDKKMEKKFLRFIKDFKPRKIGYKKLKEGYLIETGDALEFMMKFDAERKEWEEEMRETMFFFTEKNYEISLIKAGFIIKDHCIFRPHKALIENKSKYFDFEWKNLKKIRVVGEKVENVRNN